MFKIQKYMAVYWLAFLHALKNYKALIGLSIFLITCLVIFAHLWKLASTKAGIVSYDAEQLLWYIAFNEWVLVSLPDVQDGMAKDLNNGRLAYLLPRPISYLGSTFAEALGTLSVNLSVLGIVTFVFTWWQVGALPFALWGLLVAIMFGLLAGMVAIVFQMAIGISAFWLHDVNPIYWIWEKFLFMLGGLMLPLTVYPIWMQTLAAFTPFPAILGGRSSLALDLNPAAIATLLGSLIGWGFLGLIFLNFLYRKGMQILNVEGG